MANEISKLKQKRTKEFLFFLSLVVLPVIQFLIFYVYVNFNSIVLAFRSYDLSTGIYEWIGFDNFVRAYKEFTVDGLALNCIKNSIVFYLFYAFFGVSLGLVFSYYIVKKKFASNFFKVLLFLPSIISVIVLVTVFKYFVDYAFPILYGKITGERILGLISTKKTAFATIVFYNIFAGFGSSVLLYSGAMTNISDSIYDYVKIDGASPFREFVSIVVPLIFSTLSTVILAGFTGLFLSDMALFSFFGTNAERYLWTFGYYFVRGEKLASLSEYPYLSSIGLVLTFVAIPLTLLLKKVLDKVNPLD